MTIRFMCSDEIEGRIFKRFLESQLRDSKPFQDGIIGLDSEKEKEVLLITDMKKEPEIMIYI